MDSVVETVMVVGIDIVVAVGRDSVTVRENIFIWPAVSVCVPWLYLVVRCVGGKFFGCRHKHLRIRRSGVVALEVGSQESRYRPLTVVGDVH